MEFLSDLTPAMESGMYLKLKFKSQFFQSFTAINSILEHLAFGQPCFKSLDIAHTPRHIFRQQAQKI